VTLGEKQRLFARLVPRLIDKAHELGFEITLGDAYRDPRVFGTLGQKIGYGNMFSCHKVRLAIDLNLFKDGVFLTTTEAHRPLGEWWEAQHKDACWGGRFEDGNHYSLTHEGIK
jgi:hypothetical protein